MTIKECYEAMNGNYDEVVGRLMGEARVIKYVRKFAANTEFADFETAYAEKNWQEAFRHIHSLKGMCANLSMTQLFTSSSELCETLRGGEPSIDITDMIEKVRGDLKMTMDAIAGLDS